MTHYQIPGALLQDEHSSHRPPYFNGQHYSHWKDRSRIFVSSNEHQAWIVIKRGPKPIPGLTENMEQQEVIQTNARAISLLYCAVSGAEYDKISTCETAKEMWDKLEVTYEGTTKVKEARISSLVNDYELFKMAKDENVESMFSRFSKIFSELKSLVMVYSNALQVR
ncbi:hypothetical protein MTR67_040820, partial [Solanum verrucosum]